ncbi:hypothetical protein [Lacisediminihabitans changchengi]|uniref:hypothetical protein n=1 Tax=Lacisediminihabitans changchengi TaxID=2787634 RepID=UPI0027DE51E2|nr:hypothetical protein [Lacisediminihabitans changchengi]
MVAALGISSAIVWQASYSAFSATTSNATSNWAAGTVLLTNDSASTAMFTATGLKPGSTGTKCIAVTSTGTLPSAVKLYTSSPATTNALSTYITLTITQGTGGSFASCASFVADATGSAIYSGTLANIGTTNTSYANGLTNWSPTGSASETKTYQFVYTVSASAPNSVQGGTAALGFTWEANNT